MIKWHTEPYRQGVFDALSEAFGSKDKPKVYLYEFGTVEGIYTPTEDGKDIIAVFNNKPHNGDFARFLDELEEHIIKTGERITMCSFFNEDLYWHLRKKRGYGNIGSTMDRLEITIRKENGKTDPTKYVRRQ